MFRALWDHEVDEEAHPPPAPPPQPAQPGPGHRGGRRGGGGRLPGQPGRGRGRGRGRARGFIVQPTTALKMSRGQLRHHNCRRQQMVDALSTAISPSDRLATARVMSE
eukprot:7232383-Pyramimonas_sp.AAC.1